MSVSQPDHLRWASIDFYLRRTLPVSSCPCTVFAGTIRRNEHRDDLALGQFQNPLAQNDFRAEEPNRSWEARWNKWKGQ
jgi:hypothetical protein